ncbi:ribonuclease H-like protein [Wallemia mellicola]|uniref:Ribonuclease H-like protein n=1 Tax=Wallemia mellicola TaxID=1708541 RepID=A0A4T0PUH3_9BASI|nr:ribonuclease H-like protein [Wallemia mellicola]TIC14811.1 ribonuclease H-like protein [Wallemia mellicola]
MKRVLRRLSNEFIDLTAKKPAQSQPNYRKRTLYTPSVATKQSNTMLPLYSYKHPSSYTTNGMRSPALAYTQSVQEANELIQALRGHVGFDMEWKVDFRKSAKQRRTAIVQLCDDKLILVLHLHHMSEIPNELIKLLTDKQRYKIGVNVSNDGRKFYNDFKIQLNSLLELTYLAKSIHSAELGSNRVLISLDKLTEFLLQERLDKGTERVGDWENKLNWKQIEYAANDVYASYQMFDKLSSQSTETNFDKFLVDKDYDKSSSALKEIPNNDKIISNSGKVIYNRVIRSLTKDNVTLTYLQPRHIKTLKWYFENQQSLDQTRNELRPEKPLARITVILYATEILLLSKKGYSDAMLVKLQNDIEKYLDVSIKKSWYEDYGCLF